jgi:hypothetical protein
VGIKAAVHGVDPEAVEEANHCSVGAMSASFAHVYCFYQLRQ